MRAQEPAWKRHGMPRSHYDWLEQHYPEICQRAGVTDYYRGGFSSNGDKIYSYRDQCEQAGIPWFHTTAMYMLMDSVYHREVRDTPGGWVSPPQWIIANYREGHCLVRFMDGIEMEGGG
jgi:hypothetical protein